ncbi:MAG TPA: TetR/AcrR family transcriptional regulator [Streptosporangiaceae bacterium]|nr:TetR/AcrR family transcriptional regulator [Streptosporangiaceae bacterium]
MAADQAKSDPAEARPAEPGPAEPGPQDAADQPPADNSKRLGAATGTSPRRQRNPRGQGERLRDDIIEAASRLLADPAAPPLTLRGVAREAGVAATSVYLHFDDVEALVRAVASCRFTDLVRAQDAATGGLTEPCERLRAAAVMYCEFGLSHPGHYQVTFTNPLPVGVDVSWEEMPGKKAFEHFVEAVAPCIGRPPDDPESARTALLLWQQLHGTVSLRISRPRFPWPPLAESVTDAVDRIVGGSRPA